MRLLLIRHGQTPANVLGLLDTAAPGPALTALGVRQAAQLPDALRGTPIDSMSASVLVRSQLTAAPLAVDRSLGVEIRPGLHEISAGSLEGRADRPAVRIYLETVFAWAGGELDLALPDGPDGNEFFGRYDADIAAIEASGANNAVVVSHGAAIRVWVAARTTNVPPDFAADNELDNTGIVELIGSVASGWILQSWAGVPVGGAAFEDASALDPMGESLRTLRAD